MPAKSVPLSVRVSDEDAVFLANLEIADAVTPSEKLRAILHEAQRQQAGLQDAAEGGFLLRDMAAPTWRIVRRIEAQIGQKSDLILKLYERIPDIMALLVAGPEKADEKNGAKCIADFEKALIDELGVLIKDFISLAFTSPARVHTEQIFQAQMNAIMEFVELARHRQQMTKGEQ